MPNKIRLLILLFIPLLANSQVARFMGRYDVSQVTYVADSTWQLTGTFIDLTGSYTGLSCDTNDKIIQRGYDSLGRIVFDRYRITGIITQTVNDLVVNVKSDYTGGIQNSSNMPFTGSFPIASAVSDTSSLTYRTSMYQNLIDPDYDAALDNLNLYEIENDTSKMDYPETGVPWSTGTAWSNSIDTAEYEYAFYDTVTLDIPAAQIQSDWNQSNNLLLDYIKNKPTIPGVFWYNSSTIGDYYTIAPILNAVSGKTLNQVNITKSLFLSRNTSYSYNGAWPSKILTVVGLSQFDSTIIYNNIPAHDGVPTYAIVPDGTGRLSTYAWPTAPTQYWQPNGEGIETTDTYVPVTVTGGNLTIGTASTTVITDTDITASNFKITTEGGYAVSVIAGESIDQGDVVTMSSTDKTVMKTSEVSGYDQIFGVVYSTATTGQSVWVVVSGIALCKFNSDVDVSAPTSGYVAATGINGIDVTVEAGKAVPKQGPGFYNQVGIIMETKSRGTSALILVQPHSPIGP